VGSLCCCSSKENRCGSPHPPHRNVEVSDPTMPDSTGSVGRASLVLFLVQQHHLPHKVAGTTAQADERLQAWRYVRLFLIQDMSEQLLHWCGLAACFYKAATKRRDEMHRGSVVVLLMAVSHARASPRIRSIRDLRAWIGFSGYFRIIVSTPRPQP
jgi:hypothetical protein